MKEMYLFVLPAFFVSLIIFIAGVLKTNQLPEEKRKLQKSRFLCAAAIPLLFSLTLSKPNISGYSLLNSVQIEKKVEVNKLENLTEKVENREQNIRFLNQEVIKLRDELNAVNNYNGIMWKIFCFFLIGICLAWIVGKDKRES